MATLRMEKLSAIGLNSEKLPVLEALQSFGAAELREQQDKLQSGEWAALVRRDGDEEKVSQLDARLSELENILNIAAKHDSEKKPLLFSRARLSGKEYEDTLGNRELLARDVRYLAEKAEEADRLRSDENAVMGKQASLAPWAAYDVPLEVTGSAAVRIFRGVVPAMADTEELRTKLADVSAASDLELISKDEDQQYLSVFCMKEDEETVLSELRNHGFNPVYFKGLRGTAAENMSKLAAQAEGLREKREEIERKFELSAGEKKRFRCLYDELLAERDRAKIRERLLSTEETFYFEAWTPEEKEEEVRALLETHGCWYEFRETEKGEESPVLLKNNGVVYPVEAITELYSLPKSYEVDPTPIFAAFYVVFFGMMFADIAYGLILAGLCIFALIKYKPENLAYRLIKTLAYCGVSTAVWGVLFGGFFGDLPGYLGVPLEPLWINPLDNAMFVLAFSCILGVIHLFVGMGIKAYMLIRDGKIFDALCDVFIWYVFIIGLGLLLFGNKYVAEGSGTVGKYMAIAGAAWIVGCELIRGKGIGKLLGLWNLYGTTSYLADILSYSRLLALGLASAVIAQVFNMLGDMVGTGIVGAIAFIIVALIGHTVNFLINALGSFVHASRLQYVEFFGKFYEGGGTAFKPFARKGKYTKIVEK